MPNLLTFDAASHTYYLDGVEIPGVSDVLETSGLKPSYNGFHQAQLRGLHVHEACELLDLDDLEWSSVYPEWIGYVRAYELFKQEFGFVPELIEYQACHPVYRYAGTLDRRGTVEPDRQRAIILDLKTGTPEPWHRWQLAGYQLLGGEALAQDRRVGVYLHDDGTYAVQSFDDKNDIRTFLAAVTITHAKRAMNGRHQ